jgi:alpha-amylase
MKKGLVLMMVLCATMAYAQHYGILVNSKIYFAAEYKGKDDMTGEYDEYLAHVKVKSGDTFTLYNAETKDKWAVDLDTYSVAGFARSGDHYTTTNTGCYDFYIKLKWEADQLYIGAGSNCGDGEDVDEIYMGSIPHECEAVMMQAFYNESYDPKSPGVSEYGDTKWKTLTAQASEIGYYFDYVWLPPSAYGDGAGYHPKQYSNQNSNWGTRAELEALIGALHEAGSKVVADIVINHCAGYTTWCDFPEMDFGEYGVFHPDASYICQDDEVNADWNKPTAENPGSGACWGTATGSKDDGENWDGARDWSHDKVYVQEMFIAYLKWMRNVMHYDGFRYDKGDGFNNWHHWNYNKHARPEIAFMECYKGTDDIWSRIVDSKYDLMGLDFDLKWHVFNSIAGWDYSRGRGDCIMSRGNGRHSVTFIESHDWFLRPDNENEFGGRGNSMTPALKARLMQANALLLSMPGVPCVFYPHWKKYKDDLKPMIEARKWAGVHSESEVKDEYASATGYQATVVGHNGWLILCLGDRANKQGFAGFTLAASNYSTMEGHNESYEIWVLSDKPRPEGVENVQGDNVQSTKGVKFLKDGQLYIHVGDKTYDMMGQTIK